MPLPRRLRTLVIAVLAALVSLTGLAGLPAAQAVGTSFVSTWDTTKEGTAAKTIALPLRQSGTYDFTVDYGDGTSVNVTSWDDPDATHEYGQDGQYTVTITGTIEGWAFKDTGDRLRITGISDWGPLKLGNDGGYFQGAKNLEITATGSPDLTGTTDMSWAFAYVKTVGDVTGWDMSAVTTMAAMFLRVASFNEDISGWNTGNVTDMSYMFAGFLNGEPEWEGAQMTFNQDISSWDVSKVTTMEGMFHGSLAFNQSLNGWNVSNVQSFFIMFRFSHYNASLSSWTPTSATNMAYMFANMSFNQDISSWNVSSVENFSSMFEGNTRFNQPIGAWTTTSARVMRATFYGASAFNKPLTNWNTSNVWHMGLMFNGAGSFNQSLATFDMTSTIVRGGMLDNIGMRWQNYDATLEGWSTQNVMATGTEVISPYNNQPTTVDALGASGRQYTAAAVAARTTLVDGKGFTINGDSLYEPPPPSADLSVLNSSWFPVTQVGQTNTQTFTATGSGELPVTITGIALQGAGKVDYTIDADGCSGVTLNPTQTCDVTISFTPTFDGNHLVYLRYATDATTKGDHGLFWTEIFGRGYGDCTGSPFDRGSGTTDDPYILMTLDQLNCVNGMNSNGDYLYMNAHFRMGADIDARSSTTAFQPIGTWWDAFTGEFDGAGHTLKNVSIDDAWAAIFPYLDSGAYVHDLVIKDAQILSRYEAGVITPWAANTTLSDITIDGGSVTSTIGGTAGGAVGFLAASTMRRVTSSATVNVTAKYSGPTAIGGLAGWLDDVDVSRSAATGAVAVTVDPWSGEPAGTVTVGGFAGVLGHDAGQPSRTSTTVSDSYATGTVSVTDNGTAYVGGFAGWMSYAARVLRAYATGALTATNPATIGGFVGDLRDNATVVDSLWDTTSSGIATDPAEGAGTTGRTTAQMQDIATYANWSIAEAPNGRIWTIAPNELAKLTWTQGLAASVTPVSQALTGTVGLAVTPTQELTATGFTGTVTYSVSPALPAGLELDPATGVISGTPTAAAAPAIYTITGDGAVAGGDSVTVTITIEQPHVTPALSPSSQTVSATVGSAITDTSSLTATDFGGTVSYTVDPALPDGLVLDAASGVVSGTPTAAQDATLYTITGFDGTSSATSALTITVTAPDPTAPALSPATQSVSATVGEAITDTSSLTASNMTGSIAYTIDPALPDGLVLDGATGVISGTPTAAQSATLYTITGTDEASVTATAAVTITITTPVPPTPAITPVSQVLVGTVNQPVTATSTLAAAHFDGAVTYAISPTLPEGLLFDTSTGVISGTATAPLSATLYTITGTGAVAGSDSVTVTITIEAAPTPGPGPEPDPTPTPIPNPTPSKPVGPATPSAPSQGGAGGSSGLPSGTWQPPTQVTPLLPGVALVPGRSVDATPARNVRREPSPTLAKAPVIASLVGEPVRLTVGTFTPGARYIVKMRLGSGAYTELGSVVADASGRLALPVWVSSKPVDATIAIVDATGDASYVKVTTEKPLNRKKAKPAARAKAPAGAPRLKKR